MHKSPDLSRLLFITDDRDAHPHVEQAEMAAKAGVKFIQLRIKDRPYEYWKEIADQVKVICAVNEIEFIINDSVPLALEVGAGVHLGKQDMEPSKARELLGAATIIGGTANTFEDVKRLHEAGVNYIGLGPFRHTATKKELSPLLGVESVKKVMEEYHRRDLTIPVYAIGGIRLEDIPALMDAGVYGVAVSSGVINATDPQTMIGDMLHKLYEQKTLH